jgi:Protein of unknown function (DUF3048) N-terminal domain/Protein of unknown function (DUF3048) C-terminal domain
MPLWSTRSVARSLRSLSLLGLAAALFLSATACSGDAGSTASAKPQTSTSTSDTLEPSVNTASAARLHGQWPLTGLTMTRMPRHPVYVVKVDNTANAAPQRGLGPADMVVEELVEGGLTRLAAFYYSHLPRVVGPVRSMRASDISIVTAARADLVASGAAPRTVRLVSAAKIKSLTEGATGFYRDGARPAPYNLFVRLRQLARSREGRGHPPTHAYLHFGAANHFRGNIPVRSMNVTFSASRTTRWRHTRKGWTRPGSFGMPGKDFVADNVLVLRVRVGDAGYLDPAGNPVPESLFYGRGRGVLVHGTKAVTCRWEKAGKGGQLTLRADRRQLLVPTGHTWIELLPAATGRVTLTN